jgi:hypothetical protein
MEKKKIICKSQNIPPTPNPSSDLAGITPKKRKIKPVNYRNPRITAKPFKKGFNQTDISISFFINCLVCKKASK